MITDAIVMAKYIKRGRVAKYNSFLIVCVLQKMGRRNHDFNSYHVRHVNFDMRIALYGCLFCYLEALTMAYLQ